MNKKSLFISKVREYFIDKGRVLTEIEYRESTDTPIRYRTLKRVIGPWNRLLNLVGPIEIKEEETNETLSSAEILARLKAGGKN